VPDEPPTNRGAHRQALIVCALVIAAAPLLQVLPNERVAVRGVDTLVLPRTCPSREIFETNCPACGLTRSFVYLAHGDWTASWRVHRMGWLVMLLVALQIPYRSHILWGSGKYQLRDSSANAICLALILLLFGNWLIGLIAFG